VGQDCPIIVSEVYRHSIFDATRFDVGSLLALHLTAIPHGQSVAVKRKSLHTGVTAVTSIGARSALYIPRHILTMADSMLLRSFSHAL
jgi:hypothetical protein